MDNAQVIDELFREDMRRAEASYERNMREAPCHEEQRRKQAGLRACGECDEDVMHHCHGCKADYCSSHCDILHQGKTHKEHTRIVSYEDKRAYLLKHAPESVPPLAPRCAECIRESESYCEECCTAFCAIHCHTLHSYKSMQGHQRWIIAVRA